MAVSPPSASTEVVIVGGGPAGASAARLLSTWGHSVVLLAREPRRPPLGESLPPSVRKLFGLLEIQGDIDLGGFYPTTGNTVWWGEGEVRSESFAGGATGYQVQRSDFDRLLLGLAEEAGADVRRGADVRAIEGLELPPPARSREAGEGAAQGPAGGSEPISVRRPRGNRPRGPGALAPRLLGTRRRGGEAGPSPIRGRPDDSGVGWFLAPGRGLGARRRVAYPGRELPRRMGLVGTSLPADAVLHGDDRPSSHRAGGGEGRRADLPRRARQDPAHRAPAGGCSGGRSALGMLCLRLFRGLVRRGGLPAGRGRGLLHRPALVLRDQEGAGVGLAGRGRRAHLSGDPTYDRVRPGALRSEGGGHVRGISWRGRSRSGRVDGGGSVRQRRSRISSNG